MSCTTMSLSPQQQQKKQIQKQLLNDALSHGPYLWSEQDVNNALLWFPSSSNNAISNSKKNNDENSKDRGGQGESDGKTNSNVQSKDTKSKEGENEMGNNDTSNSITPNTNGNASASLGKYQNLQHENQRCYHHHHHHHHQQQQQKLHSQSNLITINDNNDCNRNVNSQLKIHKNQDNEGGKEIFLRRLIQSRGIWMPRPPRLLSSSVKNNSKRDKTGKKKRKSHGGDSNDTFAAGALIEEKRGDGRGRKRQKHGDEKNNDSFTTMTAAAKTASTGREASSTTEHASAKQPVIKNSPSPLLSIVMGYYKLHLPPSNSVPESCDDVKDGEAKSANNAHSTKTTSALATNVAGTTAMTNSEKDGATNEECQLCTEIASTKLLSDLGSIILERQHTTELYRAMRANTGEIDDNCDDAADQRPFKQSLKGATNQQIFLKNKNFKDEYETALKMNHCIDRYMTHPSTCLRRVYASSLYDRLLDLHSKGAEEDDNGKRNPDVTRFLLKIFGLAVANDKIREVILLILLEPVRRLQVKQYEAEYGTSTSEACSDNRQDLLQSREAVRHPSPVDSVIQDRPQKQSSSMNFFPLLTSTVFKPSSTSTSSTNSLATKFHNSIISMQSIERECSQPIMVSIVQFIQGGEKSPKNSSTQKAEHTNQSVTWWSLPSPLLCTISQMYFPLACDYIRYWIKRALVGHEEMYKSPNISSDKDTICTNGGDCNHSSLFQSSVWRIQQFCHTSERLYALASQIFDSIEDDYQYTAGIMVDLAVGDEYESLVSGKKNTPSKEEDFRKSLACKAIRRFVFSP